MTTKSRRQNHDEALSAFVANKTKFDQLLERLRQRSDDPFGVSPDELNWSHVGDVSHHVGLLRRITDSAFKEGEFAEERRSRALSPDRCRRRGGGGRRRRRRGRHP